MVGAALPYNMTEKELVLLTTHGSLMSLNWAFLTVFGVIIARYYRHRTWWATVHKLVQGIASVTTLPVFVIALVSGIHEGLTTIHADIGLSVVILGTLQGVMGTIMWGSISLPFCSKYVYMQRENEKGGGKRERERERLHCSRATTASSLTCSYHF
mmetsp:Transcript_29086/g.74681  ORF Transcript_29086/g.74681 Transcript_29086/m.74681 type:complete len:156 (-) Transcript_29086:910-1377(-)